MKNHVGQISAAGHTAQDHSPAAVVLGDIDLVEAAQHGGFPKILVGSPNTSVRWSRWLDQSFVMPDGWEDIDAAASALEAVAIEQGDRPVLIYGRDEDVTMLAKHGDRLTESLRFVRAGPELSMDLIDKSRFLRLAARCGLPVPVSIAVSCRQTDPVQNSDIPFPVIVKPAIREPSRWTPVAGRAKAMRFDSPAELASVWERFAAIGAELVVQEFLAGPEREIVSYHTYIDSDGQRVADFGGRKLRTLPRDFGHSTAVEIMDDPDLLALGREMSERIGLRGVAKFDLKPDSSGRLKLLEINPRFSLWHHPAAVAGTNIPALVYADLCGLPRPPTSLRAGVQWCHPITDLLASRREGIGLIEWIRFCRGSETRHGLSIADPGAGFGLMADTAVGFASSARRRLRTSRT